MDRTKRESGVELIKILAIVFIVISHVTQTLSSINEFFPTDYIIDLGVSTKNIKQFFLSNFRYFGQLGNYIFFVCSAWFLVDSSKVKPKKIIEMLLDVWIISVAILLSFLLFGTFGIDYKMIIKCFLPSTFCNNWYITCYILFYAIHPSLNLVIKSFDKKKHFITAAVMFLLYFGIHFVFPGILFGSSLIDFIVMYFVVAYLKIYATEFCNDVLKNFCLLLCGIILNFGWLALTNFLGFHLNYFSSLLLRWGGSNPFLFMIAVGILNLSRHLKFSSKIVNYISSLSLIIYVIHENILVRNYLRPLIFIKIKALYGYSHIISWVLFVSALIFIVSTLLAIFYKETVKRFFKACLRILCARAM